MGKPLKVIGNIFISALFLILFITVVTGCAKQTDSPEGVRSQSQEQSQPKSDPELPFGPEVVETNKNLTTTINEISSFEYRFYSPDKKNYISEQLIHEQSIGEPSPIKTRLLYRNNFIDFSSYPYGYEYKQKRTPAMWIDNLNVIIKGAYIFNIEKKTKKDITFPNKDSFRILNYRLAPNTQTIAYIVVKPNKVGLTSDLMVLLYNLSQNSWETIFDKEIVWMPDWEFDSGVNQVFWDADGNLYFNYSVGNEYSQIFKYKTKTKELIDFDRGYILFDISPDGRYFIIEKQELELTGTPKINYYVMQIDTHKILNQILSNRYAWSNKQSDQLIMIRYISQGKDAPKRVYLEGYSLKDGKATWTIRDDRFILSPNSHVLIDSYDEFYVLLLDGKSFEIK
jgi:hypothetical protein